ncbi:MAG: SRPBCC family protein [Burkholderiales bacterium]|nr:SRPBCC family protein [Burkholderiales bacterium]
MVRIQASQSDVFSFLDEHRNLSSHMSASSWRMGGGKMETSVDQGGGKCVGSKIRLAGRVLGIVLSVEEVVTRHVPPRSKEWATIGRPNLLIIDSYRMGFDVVPKGAESILRVFIDYDLPKEGFPRLLGYLLGRYYAQWCTRQMAEDAAKHFR